MLVTIYTYSFIVSLGGLIMWFFFQKKKSLSRKMSVIFLLGFFSYLLSLAFSDATTTYKLVILFRDLVVLGLVSQMFNFVKHNKLVFFILLGVLALVLKFGYLSVLTQTFPQVQLSDLDNEYELLVEMEDPENLASLDKLINKYNLVVDRAFFPEDENSTELDDYFVIGIPDQQEKNIKKIIRAITKSKGVDWIEQNEEIILDDEMVKDPESSNSRFFLNDPAIGQQWGFGPLEANELHQFLGNSGIKPTRKAKIAILDTGIDAKHEDIKAQYFTIQKNFDTDPKGHGTHCAGIAGAVSNNGIGIASLAPNNSFVEISSVRVLNSMGGGTQQGIINGIVKAADHGVDVISLSLGGMSGDRKQKAYSKAVKYANDKGAIVVVAAGNSNRTAKNYSPANATGVIAVAAVDQENDKAFFSNTIEDLKWGISAPGVNIYSTIPDDKYASYNGTSMATPFVSGLIGIMKSINPDLKTKDVYQILTETGIDTKSVDKTGRLIQPLKAMQEVID